MPNRLTNERGFGLTELIVVVALIGVMGLLATPSLLTYWRSSSLTAGTEELASVMHRARQLAIRRNASVCVERNSTTTLRFRAGTCAGTILAGMGTDANSAGLITDSTGLISISNGVQLGGAGSAVFTNVGGASTTGTFSVTDPKTSRSRNVQVTSTGQVIIQ
jgi:prepilin-type N-terminal cleavage/methylation domain-containing protein